VDEVVQLAVAHAHVPVARATDGWFHPAPRVPSSASAVSCVQLADDSMDYQMMTSWVALMI
jgi:hypothetical protein